MYKINNTLLATKIRNYVFPRFSEIQYFTLMTATLLAFTLSEAAQAEAKSAVLGYVGQADTVIESLMALLSICFFGYILIVYPIILAIKSIQEKPLAKNENGFVALIHYSLYGILALTSISFYSNLQSKSLLDNVNHYFTLYMLVIIVVRWFLLILGDRRKAAFMAYLIADKQYHFSNHILAVIASVAIMHQLSNIYSNIAVLIFLTTGYTLVLLKVYNLLLTKMTFIFSIKRH